MWLGVLAHRSMYPVSIKDGQHSSQRREKYHGGSWYLYTFTVWLKEPSVGPKICGKMLTNISVVLKKRLGEQTFLQMHRLLPEMALGIFDKKIHFSCQVNDWVCTMRRSRTGAYCSAVGVNVIWFCWKSVSCSLPGSASIREDSGKQDVWRILCEKSLVIRKVPCTPGVWGSPGTKF